MIRNLMWTSLVFPFLVAGCSTASPEAGPLIQARQLLEEGEYYHAKKVTQTFLADHPRHAEAQQLMAEILEREIIRQKEAFEPKALDEFSEAEKQRELRTWLERSRTLLQFGQYDEAVFAAEKVFLYDSDNLEASGLIDRIRRKAYEAGKKDPARKGLVNEEVSTRLERYRRQARAAAESGQWGAARLAIEKILLLAPEDSEALQLQDEIQKHLEEAPS